MHKLRDSPIERKTHWGKIFNSLCVIIQYYTSPYGYWLQQINKYNTYSKSSQSWVCTVRGKYCFLYNKFNSITRNFRFVLYAVRLRVLKKHNLMTRMTVRDILLYDVLLKEG